MKIHNRILTLFLVSVLVAVCGCKRRIRRSLCVTSLEFFYFHHGGVYFSDSMDTIPKDSTTIEVLIGNQVHTRDILIAYPPPYPKRVDSSRVKIWIDFWDVERGFPDGWIGYHYPWQGEDSIDYSYDENKGL